MSQAGSRQTDHERRRLALLAWAGFIALWCWFGYRTWRGAVLTETGDFNHFYWAALAMRRGEDIYEAGLGGYLYPPLIAWLFQPLTLLGHVGAALAWGLVNTLLTFWCLFVSVRVLSRSLSFTPDALTYGAVWLLAVLLTFGPVRSELEHGQTDALILTGLCAALLLVDRAPFIAGLALGLASTVKYHVVLFLPYLLVRRRWRTALGLVGGMAILLLLPAVQLGLAKTAEYQGVSNDYLLRVFTGGEAPEGVNLHPITWETSISITSGIARMLGEDASSTALYALTGVTALLVFGATWLIYRGYGLPMFVRGRGDARLERLVPLLEWCGLIVAILAFSPQTTTRHSFIMLPMHVLVAYILLEKRPGATKWPLLVAVIGFQLAARLPPGSNPAFRDALVAWRHVSGATWFLLLMWIALVWCALSFARTCPPSERESVNEG